MDATNDQRQGSTRSDPLFPRPGSNDPMLVAARRANIGARLELDRHRCERQPADRLTAIERQLEALIAAFANHVMDLVADGESGGEG